jgi:predicted transcriptional regulator
MPRVISLARTNLVKTSVNSTLKDVAVLMLNENVGSVVITTFNKEQEEILGFIDTNIILRILADGKNPVTMSVKDYIVKFPTLDHNLKVLDAWEVIKDKPEERYGIVQNSKIIGIVRKRTINDFRIRILREELHIEDEI